MESKIKEYQDILKKYTSELEIEVNAKQDPELTQLFNDAKILVIEYPNIKEEFLDFYTNWLKKEYGFITKADLESSIRILMHISEHIKELSSNTYKKDDITYVTLDESILDIDSWLPKEAIQDFVNAIKIATKKEYPKSCRRVKKSNGNQRRKNNVRIHTKTRR